MKSKRIYQLGLRWVSLGAALLLGSTLAFALDPAFQVHLVASGKELNTVYQACLAKFAPNMKEQLRIAQRAWIVFDNKNEAAYAAVGKRRGMSEEDLDRAGLPETEARTEILRTYFMLPNEDLASLRRDLEQAEQELTAVYKQCIASLNQDDEQKLREVERAWIEYRDKDMRAQSGDPSGRAAVWTSVRLARRRSAQMRAFYLQPGDATPAAPAFAGAATPAPAMAYRGPVIGGNPNGTKVLTTPPAPTPPPLDPAARAKLLADFRDAAQRTLARVEESGSLGENATLADVKDLPGPLADGIDALREQTATLRKTLEHDEKRDDYRADLQVANGLIYWKKFVLSIRAADAPTARTELAILRENVPTPGSPEAQKPLWKCLDSAWMLCNRLAEQAEPHARRAKSAADAGRTGDAMKEYQEAYKIYPDPQIAQTIKRLREDSLGL